MYENFVFALRKRLFYVILAVHCLRAEFSFVRSNKFTHFKKRPEKRYIQNTPPTKPTFSFGSTSKTEASKPSFNFGAPKPTTDTKPSFSFGAPKSDKTLTNLGQWETLQYSESSESEKSVKNKPASKPAPTFAFGVVGAKPIDLTNLSSSEGSEDGSEVPSDYDPEAEIGFEDEETQPQEDGNWQTCSDSTTVATSNADTSKNTTANFSFGFATPKATINEEESKSTAEKSTASAKANPLTSNFVFGGVQKTPSFQFNNADANTKKSDSKNLFSFGSLPKSVTNQGADGNSTQELLANGGPESLGSSFESPKKSGAGGFSFAKATSPFASAASNAQTKNEAKPVSPFGTPKPMKPTEFSFGKPQTTPNKANNIFGGSSNAGFGSLGSSGGFAFGKKAENQADSSAKPSWLNNTGPVFGAKKDENSAGNPGEEGEWNPEYQALVSLDLVDTKTGEESETAIFCERSKLFRWIDDQWKERGVGELKILQNTTDPTQNRILMRRDQVKKLCANHTITKDMSPQAQFGTDKALTWVAYDYADPEEPKLEKLCARFKTVDITKKFAKTIAEIQSKMPESSANSSTKKLVNAAISDIDKMQEKIDQSEKHQVESVPLTPLQNQNAAVGQKSKLVQKQSLSRKSSVPVLNTNLEKSDSLVGKTVLSGLAEDVKINNSNMPMPLPSSKSIPSSRPESPDLVCLGEIQPTPSELEKSKKLNLPSNFYLSERQNYSSSRKVKNAENYEKLEHDLFLKFEENLKNNFSDVGDAY